VVASAIPGYAEALWQAGRGGAERARLVRLGLARAPALDWPHLARRVERIYLGVLRRRGEAGAPAEARA
jgi:hypothetical protein